MPIILPQDRTQLNVTTLHGQVVMQFSRPVQEVVLDPQEAAEIARALAQAAHDLNRATKPPFAI